MPGGYYDPQADAYSDYRNVQVPGPGGVMRRYYFPRQDEEPPEQLGYPQAAETRDVYQPPQPGPEPNTPLDKSLLYDRGLLTEQLGQPSDSRPSAPQAAYQQQGPQPQDGGIVNYTGLRGALAEHGLTVADYLRAQRGADYRDQRDAQGHGPAYSEAAAYNSSLRYGQPQQQATDPYQADIVNRYQYLQREMEAVRQDPDLTPSQRAAALENGYRQLGHLTQMAQQRTSAPAQAQQAAPARQVDPQSRARLGQLQKAEQTLRGSYARGDIDGATLGAGLQRIQAHRQAALESAQPDDTPTIQQQVQSRIHTDPQTGVTYILQKDGKIDHILPKAEKAEKETKWGMTPQQLHKVVHDYAKDYGIGMGEAYKDIRQHFGMFETDDPGFSHYGNEGESYPGEVPPGGIHHMSGLPGHPDNVGVQAPRPLRKTVEQQHKEDLHTMDMAGKAASAAEANRAKDEKAAATAEGARQKKTEALYKDAQKEAGMHLKSHYANEAAQANQGKKPEEKVAPKEPAAEEYSKELQGRFEQKKLLHLDLPEAMKKAAGNEEALHGMRNLQHLAQKYPRGIDSIQDPTERGHWLVGRMYQKVYDDSIGELPNFDEFNAIDPRGK